MSTAPICIEVTDRYIRAAQFTSGFAGKTLVKSEGKQILGETDIPRAVASFVAENFAETSAIYLNAPARSLFAREIRVPFLESRKVRDILPFELEAQLPYEKEEIFYGSYFYPNPEYKDTSIVVCGTKRAAIEPLVEAFEERQLPLSGIYALQDAVFCLAGDLHQEVSISIFIGESTSVVIVTEAGKLKTSRIISHGYLAIARKLAADLKCKAEEALETLKSMPDIFVEDVNYDYFESTYKVSKRVLGKLRSNFEHEMSILSREIEVTARSVGFTSKDPVPLTLLTDCPFKDMLEKCLAQKTHYTARSFPYAETPLADFGNENTLLFGGVLSMTDSRQINLLQGDLRKRAHAASSGRRLSNIINLSAAFVAIALSVFLSYSSKQVQIDQAKLMQSELFEKEFWIKSETEYFGLSQAKELVEKERKKTELFRLFFTSSRLSEILVSVHRAVPMGTEFEVEMLRYDNNTLALSASCASFTELNTIKESLMASPLLEKVETSREKATPGAGGRNRIKFQMQLTPKKPEGV